MQCPKCNLEARITLSKETEEKNIKYIEREYTCMNPKCDNFKRTLGTFKYQLSKE